MSERDADKWDEGYAAGHKCVGADPTCSRITNPYRIDEKQVTEYGLDNNQIWNATYPLAGMSEVLGRAIMFNLYGWDHGVQD